MLKPQGNFLTLYMSLKKHINVLFKATTLFWFGLPIFVQAQNIKVVTNQVGYEDNKAKHAVIVADSRLTFTSFNLIDADKGKAVFTGKISYSGPVGKWRNFEFLDS